MEASRHRASVRPESPPGRPGPHVCACALAGGKGHSAALLTPTYHGGMSVTEAAVRDALAGVIDPEIRRPITDLDMVDAVSIDGATVDVNVLLTVAGCPLSGTITEDVKKAVGAVEGVDTVRVSMGVMNDEQKKALREKLNGGRPEREIPFNRPGSLTRVIAVTSGKGGVGKSSMTANLAAALAGDGLKVGVLDADIYGFSIPRMLGIVHDPQVIDGMIIPPVGVGGIKVISIGMFVPDGQAVVWRGPMLHRALQQFLGDVFWGDLDVLLIDMPPGTGDVAISIAQLLPGSEILVVTTPQVAAAEVAERAGSIAAQTHQRVIGVVENMSFLVQSDGSHLEVFGAGGGQAVTARLTAQLGYEVPLLAQVPLDISLREGSDRGRPVTAAAEEEGAAAAALREVARTLGQRARGLAGRPLGVQPLHGR